MSVLTACVPGLLGRFKCLYRPVKTCEVKGYVFIKLINIYKRGQSPLDRNLHRLHFFYIFVLDICSKPILCSKIAQKGKKLLEVAISAKSCRTQSGHAQLELRAQSTKNHISLIAGLHAREAGEAEHNV